MHPIVALIPSCAGVTIDPQRCDPSIIPFIIRDSPARCDLPLHPLAPVRQRRQTKGENKWHKKYDLEVPPPQRNRSGHRDGRRHWLMGGENREPFNPSNLSLSPGGVIHVLTGYPGSPGRKSRFALQNSTWNKVIQSEFLRRNMCRFFTFFSWLFLHFFCI